MAKEGKKKDKAAEAKPVSASGGDYGLVAAGPGSSGTFIAKEHLGDLLLVYPNELVENMTTSASTDPTDAIRADVVVLSEDPNIVSERIDDALLFGKVVVNQLRGYVGKSKVVGRWSQAEAKPGRTAAWILQAPTDSDITVAKQYLDALNPLR